MSLTQFHSSLANTAMYYFLILALWGLWRFARKQGVDSSFWGALVISEVLVLLQGGLGVYLWINGLRPGRGWIHILYGVVSALTLPAIFAFTRGDNDRRVMMIYGVALLFLVGITIRAAGTGI
ncbi:MAG: hypothetical protein JSV61_06280 [Anaerolineales bacterium]|nr:MAG: hypothetical protein JSV61_06280 [Anaerolineales bacterium]